MRVADKLALIDTIGRALQSRFGYIEIDAFLAEYGIPKPQNVNTNSKRVYSKVALQGVAESTILKIAKELDIAAAPGVRAAILQPPPRNWIDTTEFRLFISHASAEKQEATRLKDCLAPYAIAGFVAHEDIHPTLEWQSEIERALQTMDAFIAIHTQGFSTSNWTQQEIGFALGRGVKVISFKMGEDPTGFISKHQALNRGRRSAEDVAAEINGLLAADDRTSARLQSAKATQKDEPGTYFVPF